MYVLQVADRFESAVDEYEGVDAGWKNQSINQSIASCHRGILQVVFGYQLVNGLCTFVLNAQTSRTHPGLSLASSAIIILHPVLQSTMAAISVRQSQ